MTDRFVPFVIKSFKYNGSLHRSWLNNWLTPASLVLPHHHAQQMDILINDRTPIIEANGEKWISRAPGISFFIPKMWFNVVALLEPSGIRYYCNIASPPYRTEEVLTYIDYDLDVIVMPNKLVTVVDQEEYERHKRTYQYPPFVQQQVQDSLDMLLKRIELKEHPFQDEDVYYYYEHWKKRSS